MVFPYFIMDFEVEIMQKKNVLWIIAILVLIYPIFALFNATEALGTTTVKGAENQVLNYQVSIWITWVVLVSLAVYYKWTRKKNIFFFFIYAFLVVGFGIFGYLTQNLILAYDLPSQFSDTYTFGLLIALQNIVTSAVLTGFLQAAVWWFTRRWHRR